MWLQERIGGEEVQTVNINRIFKDFSFNVEHENWAIAKGKCGAQESCFSRQNMLSALHLMLIGLFL